jgi:hypothetical protein
MSAMTTTEGARLKAQQQRAAAAEAALEDEAVEAHLALPPGERLARAVRLSDTMLKLWREAGRPGEGEALAEADATYRRVYEHLQRLKRRG